MNNKQLNDLLRYAAIAGNILFILWISFNAMDEGIKGTLVQKVAGITMILLLGTNIFFLLRKQHTL